MARSSPMASPSSCFLTSLCQSYRWESRAARSPCLTHRDITIFFSCSVVSLVGGKKRLEPHSFSFYRSLLTSLVVIPGADPLPPAFLHLGTTSPSLISSTFSLGMVRAR